MCGCSSGSNNLNLHLKIEFFKKSRAHKIFKIFCPSSLTTVALYMTLEQVFFQLFFKLSWHVLLYQGSSISLIEEGKVLFFLNFFFIDFYQFKDTLKALNDFKNKQVYKVMFFWYLRILIFWKCIQCTIHRDKTQKK